MAKSRIYLFVLSVLFSLSSVYGQLAIEGSPVSMELRAGQDSIKQFKYSLPEDYEAHEEKAGAYAFAYSFDVDIDFMEEATWKDLPDGGRYGRLELISPGAKSLNVIFSEYKVPNGGKLYFYSPGYEMTLGAFSKHNNKASGMLAVAPVAGDTLIIEYVENKSETTKAKLVISKVSHDYKGVVEKATEGNAGSCNVDINCDEGEDWQIQKRAVCKMIFDGNYLCTGALINNAKNDGIPYILSANHCISSQSSAESLICLFNYEAEECDGTEITAYNSISGADLIATDPNSKYDFVLMELTDTIPTEYNVYYMGWTLDEDSPSSSVGIHHPSGDLKKISLDYDQARETSYGDGYASEAHWLIEEWDVGVTEGGSSGSPLFDESSQLLVGTLTGGEAACGNPVNDYYAQFYEYYNHYSDSSAQLKHWLDPDDDGIEYCLGYDPLLDGSDYTSNIASDEHLEISNFTDAYLSGGHTYDNAIITVDAVAEKIAVSVNSTLYALHFPFYISDTVLLSEVNMVVWEGEHEPETVLWEQSLSSSDMVSVISDGMWMYIELETPLSVSNNIYIGFEYDSHITDFNFYMVTDRDTEESTLYYNDGTAWYNTSEIGLYTSMGLEVLIAAEEDTVDVEFQIAQFTYNIDYFSRENKYFKIYPNPVYTNLLISFDGTGFIMDEINVQIIDMQGRVVHDYTFTDNTLGLLTIDVSDLYKGSYLFRIRYGGLDETTVFYKN